MPQPIDASVLVLSDDLLGGILSFLVPTKLSDVRSFSSLLYQVSPRFGDIFLRCLQATPVNIHIYNCCGNPGIYEQEELLAWAKQNSCKVGGFHGSVVARSPPSIVSLLAEMDLSQIKDVDLEVTFFTDDQPWLALRNAYYSLLAQPSLERLRLHDRHTRTEGWHSLFSIQKLKQITLTIEIFREVKANLEALPSLECLKLDEDEWNSEDLSFESSSLQILDMEHVDVRIDHLNCPSLKRLICRDFTFIEGRFVVSILESAVHRDEFDIQEKSYPGNIKVTTVVKGARAILGSDDFHVAPDCQIILYTFPDM